MLYKKIVNPCMFDLSVAVQVTINNAIAYKLVWIVELS